MKNGGDWTTNTLVTLGILFVAYWMLVVIVEYFERRRKP